MTETYVCQISLLGEGQFLTSESSGTSGSCMVWYDVALGSLSITPVHVPLRDCALGPIRQGLYGPSCLRFNADTVSAWFPHQGQSSCF